MCSPFKAIPHPAARRCKPGAATAMPRPASTRARA